MKAEVLTVMENGAPKLPPMHAEDGYCLHFIDPVSGELKGGFSLLSEPAIVFPSVLVIVEMGEAAFAEFIDDTAFDIQWWKEITNDSQA